jgi:hypothetical protein
MIIVYVRDPGVFGVVLKWYTIGADVKWYLDGIEFKAFLLEEEYLRYSQGNIGGMNVK